MNKILITLLLFSLTKFSFAQGYTIQANVTGFPNGTKFFVNDSDTDTDIDSATIQNGQFVLKGKLFNNPQNLWIYANAGEKYYYFTLLIGNEKISVKGDANDFPFDLSITGSEIQDVHSELTSLTKSGSKERNELLNEYFAKKGDSLEVKRIWKAIAKIDSSDLAIRKSFVNTHLNTYEGLDALFYLKKDLSKDSLQQMFNAVNPSYQRSRFGKRIATYLKVGKILDKGDQSVDFTAFDTNGKQRRLHEQKGKYVLVDFSTTYCGPCMESIDELKMIAHKYKDQLSLITFSCDGNKEIWLKGVKRDTPPWPSLWDGKANFGETVMKYGIEGYPTFVLIDPQGMIVSKWSGYGKNDTGRGDLEIKIESLLTAKSGSVN